MGKATAKIGVYWMALGFLVLFAALSASAEEGEPWLETVETAEDRAMLAGLLNPDSHERIGFALRWDEEKWAFYEKHEEPEPPPGPDEESDFAEPRDAFEKRREQVLKGLLWALEEAGPLVRTAACESIQSLRTPFFSVLTALTTALEDEDHRVRTAAVDTIRFLLDQAGGRRVEDYVPKLVDIISDHHEEVRREAVRAVSILMEYPQVQGDLRRRAVRAVADAIEDPSGAVREMAYAAISHLLVADPALVAVIRRGLEDPTPKARAMAAHVLKDLAEDGHTAECKKAVPRLRELLDDPTFEVRWAAGHALWGITGDPEGLLPVCLEALDQLETLDCCGVADLAWPCRILCAMGPGGRRAAPALVRILNDVPSIANWTKGTEPLEALWSVGPALEDVREAFSIALESGDAERRWSALRALLVVHATPDEFADFLFGHLKPQEYPNCERMALAVLVERLPDHPGTLERVHRALDSDDGSARAEGAAYAGVLGRRARAFVPRLLEILAADVSRFSRTLVIRALGQIGSPAAIEAVTGFLDDLRDGEEAWKALASAGENAAPALGHVAARLEHNTESAARVLAAMGQEAAPALQGMQARLARARGRAVVLLADAIRLAGGKAEPCVQALRGVLSHEESSVREEAAYALGRWGRKASPALKALRKLRDLSDDRADDGIAAAVATFQIDGDPAPALMRCLLVLRCIDPLSENAIRGIGLLGPAGTDGVPFLVAAALRWRTEYRKRAGTTRAAIDALGRIGPCAHEALPALRSLRCNRLFTDVADEAIDRIVSAAPDADGGD